MLSLASNGCGSRVMGRKGRRAKGLPGGMGEGREGRERERNRVTRG